MKRRTFLRAAAGAAPGLWALRAASPQEKSESRRLLPLFPLEVVAFPGQELPLYIFEARYRELLGECRDEGITFGMPPYVNGRVMQLGTELELVSILKTYGGGEMDVLVKGLRVFRLETLIARVPGKLYPGGEVLNAPEDFATVAAASNRLRARYERFHRLVESGAKLPADLGESLSYTIAPTAGLSFAQQIELLSIRNEVGRQKFLLEYFDAAIPKLDGARGPGDFV